jgi:16S rRNA (adenine1518-N6/adenine1519-N6)-dimethyltransferase
MGLWPWLARKNFHSMMAHIPRKRFGQHFLADPVLIDALVRAIGPAPGQPLVEIGPGLGALTLPLLELTDTLTVVELDRDLVAHWRRHPRVKVLDGDVLKLDVQALAAQSLAQGLGPLRVVGNLPYNISTPILFHFMQVAHAVQDQHFMLQKEVVERMVAQPGCKAYGRLSVMLQWRYQMQWLLDVPPEAFDPPPRVDSAVVRMVPRPNPAAVDERRLEQVVALAFSQRRKILRHTLGRWMDEQHISSPLNLQQRAEEIPVQAYVELAQAAGPLHAGVPAKKNLLR